MKKLLTSFALFFFVTLLWSRAPLAIAGPITPVNVTVCQEDLPYTFNNQLLTDPGTYWDTLQTASGADSIIQLNLLVKCCHTPTNTPNFADFCEQAPLLCASFMDATVFDLSNSTPDVPNNLAAQFCYPIDHSRWLRFSACSSTVILELSVQDCSGIDPTLDQG